MRRIACCAMFIASLAAARVGHADPPERDAVGPQAPEAQLNAEELKIERSLSRKVSLHFDNAALSDVIKHAAKLGELNIVLDTAGLEDEGVTGNTNVSINVDSIRLKSALNLLLEPLRLGFKIEAGEIKITSRMKLQGELVTVSYSVADLVAEFPGAGLDVAARKSVQADFTSLMNLISTTVQPDSWEELSGPGSMMPNRTTFSLVIHQTQAIQDEIADLLGQLRRLDDLAVSLKMTLLAAPEDRWPRYGHIGSFVPETQPISSQAIEYTGFVVRDAHARLLLDYLKHRPTTSVVPVPKLCLCNGQASDLIYDTPATAALGASSNGFKIHAKIAADRKSLRLKIAAPVGDANRALESTISFSARNHETVVCDVTRLLEIYRQAKDRASGAAVDEQAARESKGAAPKSPGIREFLVVTPQVLIPEEEEELIGIDLPER